MTLRDELASFLDGEVDATERARAAASRDTSLFAVTPELVVYPHHAADIAKLVQYVAEHPGDHLSLTARSGGTDMTGGPLTTSIVIDMSRHLNHFLKLEGHTATAEPGLFYRDFEAATLEHNLLLPSYPASREICTIGGMVANNAGGEKTLTYGKTADYVKQLKVILRDGHEYVIQPLDHNDLKAKVSQNDFEGDIYRRLAKLLHADRDLLAAAKPDVSKNSAGYALWDIWNQDTGIFDLTRLFTGSQGTLGLITEVTIRLIKPKPHHQMLVIFLRDLKPLATIIQRILKYQPETFESYDDKTLQLALKFLPGLMKQMKTRNLIALGLSFIPELRLVLTGGLPQLVLLAEFTGYDPHEVHQRAVAARAALKSLNISSRLTKTADEVAKYWTIRRESFNLLRHKVHDKRTAPFIDDIVVRPERLPQFLPQLDAIMSRYDLTYTIAGHVGDGNFHIIPLMDPHRPDFIDIIEKLGDEVYNLVFHFKGSISGEHNDGLIRTHYLRDMFGSHVYKLFQETKHIFDPNNIFNPGKKVDSDWKWAKTKIERK